MNDHSTQSVDRKIESAPADRSPSAGQDTRARLIEAAMNLFVQQGYHATGVAQILKAANARSGSLYHYFPTKEDLLLAVLEEYKVLLYPIIMDPVFERVSDPIERVFGVLDSYRRMLTETGCRMGCPIGNLALELSDSHPAARRLLVDNFDGWKRAVESCLEAARDRLPEGVDPESLSAFVLTVMEGGMMQAKTYKSIEPFEEAVALLRDYFDRLLADGTDWSVPRANRE
ncbi:MAG: TetR/AcrR family transcriptional regulator [Phycisphaerales bacterium]